MRAIYVSKVKKNEIFTVISIHFFAMLGYVFFIIHTGGLFLFQLLPIIIALPFFVSFLMTALKIVSKIYLCDGKIKVEFYFNESIMVDIVNLDFRFKKVNIIESRISDPWRIFFNMNRHIIIIKLKSKKYIVSNRDGCADNLINYLQEQKLI
ncbi:hypothetical protein [Moritella sp. 28]|uniref:hypothetical protein n=1 Tax=Moritella sp. 28 TaxID=2746232 RepID=UPI001BAAA8E1|nr:hypothetical protein [Moritella sp. 28]QUM86399.1 hypothetical protein HWV02_18745 [Moritella sp. 28]